jgi:site-specific DNA-methyltransferase (adenine-specific)
MSHKPTIIGDATLYLGDCLEILPTLGKVDAVVTDPPYGETSLKWDVRVEGWADLLQSDCLWCFGSARFFFGANFAGWQFAQDVVWEKHNGSVFHADRFRRVHELIIQFYRGRWADLWKAPVYTNDATARTVRRKRRPVHTGHIEWSAYESHDGGPRLLTSVLFAPSCHGYAEHPTQKPTDVIDPLIRYSCPHGGTILDPFMGSGTTGVVCAKLGRKFIGIEIEPKYFDIACKRIEQAYAQPDMFIEPPKKAVQEDLL